MNAGKTLFAQVMELARTWGRTGSLPRSKASGRRDSVNFLSVPKFPPQVPPENEGLLVLEGPVLLFVHKPCSTL